MKKTLIPLLCVLFVALGMLAVNTPSTEAVTAFKTEFKTKYIKDDSDAVPDKALAEAYKDAGCNICHKGGFKDRVHRNAYGLALSEFLDKEKDKYTFSTPEDEKKVIQARIQEALGKVEELPSDKDDANSPTFGKLIGEGKLPAEVVKELPEGSDAAE